jgi:hypothetical protein
MAEDTTFDTLVAQLTKEERKTLLDTIRLSAGISGEPLKQEEEGGEVDLVKEYEEAGFFVRVLLFFRSLFSGKEKLELMEEYIIARFGREIERMNPGLLSTQEEIFLGEMYGELEGLKSATSIFAVPLDTVLGSRKRVFIAFLMGLEMEVLHSRLMEETDPFLNQDHYKGMSDSSVRSELEMKLEDLLHDISKGDKERIQEHLGALHSLKELTDYGFDFVLTEFENNDLPHPRACFIRTISDNLDDLAKILKGLVTPPDPKVLQALFLFLYEKELEDEDFNLEERMKRQLERSETALNTIRNFNRNVPLIKILKYAKKDITYLPASSTGGEDWFAQYRKFWEDRVEAKYKAFVEENRREVLIEDAKEFLECHDFPFLDNYTTAWMDTKVSLRYRYSVGFLNAFIHRYILDKLNRPIKLILIDGEFYKDQNRRDFNDAYNGLLQIDEQVKSLERDLGIRGNVRRQLEEIEKEIIPIPLKKKKMRQALSKLESDASQIVHSGFQNIKLLHDVLYGVLHGQVGGRFDTLANLSYLGGRENVAVKRNISEAITSTKTALDLLDELTKVE